MEMNSETHLLFNSLFFIFLSYQTNPILSISPLFSPPLPYFQANKQPLSMLQRRRLTLFKVKTSMWWDYLFHWRISLNLRFNIERNQAYITWTNHRLLPSETLTSMHKIQYHMKFLQSSNTWIWNFFPN